MKTFAVPEQLLLAIGNFLATCPYNQVAKMIKGLETDVREIKEIKDGPIIPQEEVVVPHHNS